MGEKARWGPFGFTVSPTMLVPFDGLSTSFALKTETGNDTSGTGATNTRGLELQQISFNTRYMRALGVDPRERLDAWKAQLGNVYPLYVGTKRFGPEKMMLTSVSVSELLLNNNGDFLSVSLDITLKEYTSTETTSTTVNTAAAAQASSVYSATVARRREEAMNAGASASDKEAKK